MDFTFETNNKGHIRRRESFDLEFKANFHLGNNLLEYCRSLVGMANNRGGQIIFGIKDKPRIPEGMTNNKFIECDPAKINQTILEYFSSEIDWNMDTLIHDTKEFGVLSVKESSRKPIICKKNGDKTLREAAIYYRYRGETKEIQFAELINILDQEREKERILWIKHIEKISAIGPKNVHLLDIYKGEISVGSGKILIDRNVIDKIKFIEEGNFTEREGVGMPTLKLIGDIEGIVEANGAISTDLTHPLFTKDLCLRLGFNNYEIRCCIWKLQIKGNPLYHTTVKSSQSTEVQKYSGAVVELINKAMSEDSNFLEKCKSDYKESNPIRSKRRK